MIQSISRIPERGDLYDQPTEVKAYIDQTRSGFMARIERNFVQTILKKFGHLPTLNVLDIGTGPGWIASELALARPNWKVSAVDASVFMLSAAQKNAEEKGAKVNWIHGKAETIPMLSESCDLILSHFAFSEFPDGTASLNEMARLLKPGGSFIIQDLQRPSWPATLLLMTWKYLISPFNRINHQYYESLRGAYTPRELQDLLKYSSSLALEKMISGFQRGWLVQFWGSKKAS